MKSSLSGRLLPLWVRVAVSFSLLLLGLFLAANWATYHTIEHGFLRDLDRDLLALAQTEIASAVDEPGSAPHLHAHRAGHHAAIYLPNGKIVAASPGIPTGRAEAIVSAAILNFPATDRAAESVMYFSTSSGDELDHGGIPQQSDRFVIIAAPESLIPGARLVLGMSQVPLLRTLGQIRNSLWHWSLVGLLAGGALAAALARSLTKPLESMVVLASGIHEGELEARIPLSNESSEIHALQMSLNDMLDRLQASLRNQELRAQSHRQFVADASHEMRTPLHGLLGTLEISLRSARSPEQYRDTIETALKETRRLSSLVQDMLQLSRHDLDQFELNRESTRLDILLRDCQEAHQARAGQQGTEIVTGTCQELSLKIDPGRIRQVLDNLVSNAVRYAPEGSQIELGMDVSEKEARLWVRDSGPGLEPEQYETIFERFARMDQSRERTSGGLGLGLAIARSLAQAHRGRLWGERAPQGGSIFWLALPL